MTNLKRFSSPWLMVLVFLGTVVAVPATHRMKRRQPLHVDTPREMAQLLSETCPDLHVIPDAPGGKILNGFYLTTNANKTYSNLVYLRRQREQAEFWTGCVFCVRQQADLFDVEQLGDHCLVAPPFLFFGDRVILERIDKQLSQTNP